MLKFTIPDLFTHRRHWRFNSLLLSDVNFVKYISDQISLFLEINLTPDVPIRTVWEALKAYLRGQIIYFTAKKKRESISRQKTLGKQIANVDRRHSQNPTDALYKERLILSAEYDRLTSHHTEYLLLKNRSDVYEHGDKSGEMLARQLKSARAKQVISGVMTENGTLITDQQGINAAFQSFYSRLYTSDNTCDSGLLSEFFRDLPITTLSSNDALMLDAPLHNQEIAEAIRALNPHKSPGLDGLPSEFYVTFAEKLVPLMTTMFIDSRAQGSLPDSLNQACITLLPKKDKNLIECGSYRPISLLNCDYKILAKVLARRLEKVLPNIVSPDQTGFIKDRRFFFSIRRLFNILYTPSTDKSECIISMDAEKAFDRVEWEYLFETLRRFGFGSSFLSWIKLLYACPSAMVLTNNTYSKLFRLHRGTRQGCPLSPLLFVLAIEPLAIAARNNTSIHGISRWGMEHKLALYADDLLLFISRAEETIPHILTLLTKFRSMSGYKLNLHKSELMPLNLSKSALEKIDSPFKIAQHSFVYLGITVTREFCKLFRENLNKLKMSIQQDLSKWSPLYLSMVGRVNVIKMSILPKCLYLFQSLPVYIPNNFFKELDSIILSFIWKGKKPRLRKEHLQKAKREGGLSLPNFRYYHWAANLCCVSFWAYYSTKVGPPWVEMEKLSFGSLSLPSLIGAQLPLSKPLVIDNPVVRESVKICHQFRKHFGYLGLSLFSPVASNYFFAPSILDATFQEWLNGGITTFNQLFFENQFVSFQQLSNSYSLPATHFFRYLQVRHFIATSISGFPNKPSKNVMDDIFCFNPTQSKSITKMLKSVSCLPPSMQNIKLAWEQDLQISISDAIWDNILLKINYSSMCARHCLIQFKIVHRAHLSKAKLSKMFPQTDPTCDRCKQADATLIHMFWSCPRIQCFWEGISQAYTSIFGFNVSPCPLMLLFGICDDRLSLPSGGHKIIAFSSLLARRLILLKWKDTEPPNVSHWVKDVLFHLKLEKMRYTLKGSEQKFYKVWNHFLNFVNNPSTKITE
uniref:Reverse transcriptase domain-containing protein n=1 Tax=Oryzias melastigma TaxID=30732 RepID=A0A3B3CPH8_ORYME